jgi:hypothetical protein
LAIVITVTCEGLDHRFEFRDDGEIVMLDHSEKLVRSFVAFGAKPPECMEEIDKAREEPIDYLFYHLDVENRYFFTANTVALLACEFAEHVLPIWYEYFPNDDRPKKAIQAARKYLAGKIKLETFRQASAAARVAYLAATEVAGARSAAWAASWATISVVAASRAADVAWSADAAALRAKEAARWAAHRHAKYHGNDPDVARDVEKKWQVGKAVQVFEAVSRGEDPWQG